MGAHPRLIINPFNVIQYNQSVQRNFNVSWVRADVDRRH